MAARILILIRHGQYDREANPLDGRGGGLTPLGAAQARRAAKRLAGLPVDAIHTSDLRRAVETAQIIASRFPGVPVRQTRKLRECLPPVAVDEMDNFADYSLNDFLEGQQQADAVFETYFRAARGADRLEILVCHGNLIRYLACRAIQAAPELWLNMDILNCSLSEVVIVPGKMRLTAFSDSGHLAPELRTYM